MGRAEFLRVVGECASDVDSRFSVSSDLLVAWCRGRALATAYVAPFLPAELLLLIARNGEWDHAKGRGNFKTATYSSQVKAGNGLCVTPRNRAALACDGHCRAGATDDGYTWWFRAGHGILSCCNDDAKRVLRRTLRGLQRRRPLEMAGSRHSQLGWEGER
ncbi:hypothetical protein PHYPSEUDO_009500 [Phytophthora pseudosyringae]|uniref:Uncharacterized protein n=1 Tax=Phytophthora pseudosyringae TaxID=221518 RepID=A0A8T1VH53_9STRA|nr:hypothetical protein PHYPSEUDO_009500 [Phytophthora pseudosyringae]